MKLMLKIAIHKKMRGEFKMLNSIKKARKTNRGITLIALVITIVLNCSCLAMEQMLKKQLESI